MGKSNKKKRRNTRTTTVTEELLNNPRAVITRLARSLPENPQNITTEWLIGIADAVPSSILLREAGVGAFLIQLLVEPQHLSSLKNGKLPWWLHPLNGLVNLCISLEQKPNPVVDHIIKRQIREASGRIIILLWNEMNEYLGGGLNHMDVRREVSRFIQCLALGDGLYIPEVHSNEGLSLVFTCWILPTTHGAEMSQTVTSVLECRDRLPEMIIRRRVFDIMGVDKLLTHVQTFLQDPTVHGNELKSEWIAALPLIQEKPLQFLDIRLPTSINIAFARQAVNSADKVDEETASIIQSSGVALGLMWLGAANEIDAITAMILSGLFYITGEALLRCHKFSYLWGAYQPLVDRVCHIVQCTSTSCDHPFMSKADNFIKIVRRSFDEVYLSYAEKLTVLMTHSGKPLDVVPSLSRWRKIVEAVKTSEGEIREMWKQHQRCSYVHCPNRSFHLEQVAKRLTSRCATCRETFYDSKECQTKDWKRHKWECKQK